MKTKATRSTNDEAIAKALEAYHKAEGPAQKAYIAAMEPAKKAFDEAKAKAEATYTEALGPLQKAWEDAVALSRSGIDKACIRAIVQAQQTYLKAREQAERVRDEAIALLQ